MLCCPNGTCDGPADTLSIELQPPRCHGQTRAPFGSAAHAAPSAQKSQCQCAGASFQQLRRWYVAMRGSTRVGRELPVLFTHWELPAHSRAATGQEGWESCRLPMALALQGQLAWEQQQAQLMHWRQRMLRPRGAPHPPPCLHT